MDMLELKRAFTTGKFGKDVYCQLMYEKHVLLEQYCNLIKETLIKKIEIDENDVVMTTNRGIKLICNFREVPAGIALYLLNSGVYEEKESALAAQLIDNDDIVFDIGANVGYFTLNILKNKPSAQIHAFEPVPETFSFLLRNLELNSCSNVTTYNFGFFDKEEEVEFFVPSLSGAASVKNIFDDETAEKIKCRLVRLDDFINNTKLKIDFIKCDIEGAEYFTFLGGVQAIQENKPIIMCEMLRKHARRFDYHPNKIIEILFSFGYRCFTFEGDMLIEFFTMDEQTMQTDFFFLHSEKHKEKIVNYNLRKI